VLQGVAGCWKVLQGVVGCGRVLQGEPPTLQTLLHTTIRLDVWSFRISKSENTQELCECLRKAVGCNTEGGEEEEEEGGIVGQGGKGGAAKKKEKGLVSPPPLGKYASAAEAVLGVYLIDVGCIYASMSEELRVHV